MDDLRVHWEKVYSSKRPSELSWYQPHLNISVEMIEQSGIDTADPIIDVGGGASTLVDDLLGKGFRSITVVDLSPQAIGRARERLGETAALVEWRTEDILLASLPRACYRLWHDRAAFHFLTNSPDRKKYVRQLRHALAPGGFVIISTFSTDGPRKCSGLDVCRYSPATLLEELGPDFQLVSSLTENHVTPSNAAQAFIHCLFLATSIRVPPPL